MPVPISLRRDDLEIWSDRETGLMCMVDCKHRPIEGLWCGYVKLPTDWKGAVAMLTPFGGVSFNVRDQSGACWVGFDTYHDPLRKWTREETKQATEQLAKQVWEARHG